MIQILCISFLLLGIAQGVYKVYKSSSFIKDSRLKSGEKLHELYKEIVIIIPVYNEQNIIKDSVESFKKLIELGIEVIYVATEKENSEVTTYVILEDLKKEYKLDDCLKILKYPKKDGVMAHQLNYAVSQIQDDKIIMIYNVDSVIDINSINYILENKDKLERGVFQQYSYSEKKSADKFIMNAELWQNRWSVAYELPRTIHKFKFGIEKFNYVIGHGLVIRKELLKEIGGFSEQQINEDNVLGYKLHMEKINIYPIPFLEKIDFASNIKIYVKQQSVWFNGPLYAFNYFAKFIKGQRERKVIKPFFVACQNFKNALNWMPFPYFCIYTIIYTLLDKDGILLIVIVGLLLVYTAGINKLSESLLIKKGYLSDRQDVNFRYFASEIIFWLLIHSFGPIITIIKIINGKNNQKNKYKTEK